MASPRPSSQQITATGQTNLGGDVTAGQARFSQTHVLALQPITQEVLEPEKVFVAQVVAGQTGDRVAVLLQFAGHVIQRLIPTGFHQFAILTNQRFAEAVGGVGKVVNEAPFVANPDFVDGFVLPGHDTFDDGTAVGYRFAACTHGGITAHRAVRANAGDGGQFPRPCAKTEIGRRQRPYRTNVGCVAAPHTVKPRLRHRHNFQAAPAIVETNDRVIHDFFLESNAARTLDAALPVQVNQVAQRDVFRQLEFIGVMHPALTRAMFHGQVLQRAFAAFVTNRTVQRMTGQQKFDDRLARFQHGRGSGAHDHAF
jgi:hypothetical protein